MTLSEQVKAAYPIEPYIAALSVKIGQRKSDGFMCSCPLHDDKTPSCSVNTDKGVWKCFSCDEGGTVIDLHMRLHNMSLKDALYDLAGKAGIELDAKRSERYRYNDKAGRPVMEVERVEASRKKRFVQYRVTGDGQVVPGVEGVARTLYRIDKWQGLPSVSLCEGEKCVHAFERIKHPATTNPGGSSAWLDAYGELLRGKMVEIWPDNDKAGDKWLDAVIQSLAGKVKAFKICRVADPYNDIADVMDAKGEELAVEYMTDVADKAAWIDRGVMIDLLSADEVYERYTKRVLEGDRHGIHLGNWLPTLGRKSRPLLPGDLVSVLADTGVGKTGILANIAYSQPHVPIIFFELELAPEPMGERFVARDHGIRAVDVERDVREGRKHSVKGWSHIYLCPNSNVTVSYMAEVIEASELKIGAKPGIVLVDYIGLVNSSGQGKRYERVSQTAEDLKRLARSTGTVVVMASQVRRDDTRVEVGLHDAKESGSIENSSQLVLGAWRPDDATIMIKVLKQTKMAGNPVIECNYDGDKQLITERTRNEQAFTY